MLMRECSHSFTLGDRQSVWETKREASVWWLETIRVNGKRKVRNSLTKKERGGRRHTKLGGDDKRAHLLHWHLSLRFIVSPSKIKRAEGRSFFFFYIANGNGKSAWCIFQSRWIVKLRAHVKAVKSRWAHQALKSDFICIGLRLM